MWDPQNFGALLRTAYFLRCDKVVVCSKNSAPLSGAVSKASAGALEVMPVYSTNNLMSFLDRSKENGWQVRYTPMYRTEAMHLALNETVSVFHSTCSTLRWSAQT